MPALVSHKYHDEIEAQGFTVIKGFLSLEEVEKYKKCSEELIQYARDGKWGLVRTRGKQFPPWPKGFDADIWGVTSLLHPDLGQLSQPYHGLYADARFLNVVGDILQCDATEISMELLNMLINPLTDFELDWHRDTIKPEVSKTEELDQLLQNPYAGAQFNLALTDDDCLIVIPSSHSRIRTDEEREITINPETRKLYIPGEMIVHLEPGDVVFYNSNILHRARYDSSKTRITLHGSYGHVKYGESRAKGILQHGVGDWIEKLETEETNLQMLRDKLIELSNKFKGEEIEYALDG